MEKFREPRASITFSARKGSALKKMFRMVRFTLFCFFLSLIQVMALDSYSQQTRISLNQHDQRLEEVLKTIEDKSEFFFLYNRDLINVNQRVNINASNQTINRILDELLKGTDISYSVVNRQIILSNLEGNSGLSSQQPISISGKVTDSSGAPLPGVTVVVKGTTNGTITDANGKYILDKTPEDAILSFSFVGMKTQEIKITGRTLINIKFEEETVGIEEIVAVGYGTVKKRDLTGAVTSVNASKIASVPITSAGEALQGRVAGVLVSTTNWAPGNTPSILIRGKRSINASNDALIVVDGIPISGGIQEISPSDIESMEVLKDASSTAIYGARGANGVILITTKRGREGVTQVDYNGYYGMQTVLNQLEFMNGSEYTEYVRESYRATGFYTSDIPSKILDYQIPAFGGRSNGGDLINFSDPSDPYTWESISMAYDANGNYDPSKVRADSEWWNKVQRIGMIEDHQLSVRGGNEKNKFLISGTYNKSNGIYKNQDYQRYSIRFNQDSQIGKYIKMGGQTQFSHSLQNNGGFSGNWRVMPIGRYYDDNGNMLNMVSGAENQWWNPLQNLVDGAYLNLSKINRYMGSYYGEIGLPVSGLRFRTNVGLDFISEQDYQFYGSKTTHRIGGTNYAKNATEDDLMYTWENLLFYDKKYKAHNFGLTLLQSIL